MSRAIKITGHVKDGQLYVDDIKLRQHVINSLEGKEIEEVIQEKHTDPTSGQFGYWHSVLLPIALEAEAFGGWTKRELDRFLTKKFLGDTAIKEIRGIPTEVDDTPSKANISRKKWIYLIDQSIIFFSQLEIEIPEPEHKRKEKYHDEGKFTAE